MFHGLSGRVVVVDLRPAHVRVGPNLAECAILWAAIVYEEGIEKEEPMRALLDKNISVKDIQIRGNPVQLDKLL